MKPGDKVVVVDLSPSTVGGQKNKEAKLGEIFTVADIYPGRGSSGDDADLVYIKEIDIHGAQKAFFIWRLATRLDRLKAFLESMGQTEQEIAAFMRKHGIKGNRRAACNCPVTNALKRKFRGINASTTDFRISALDMREVFFCGPALSSFIRAFDNGWYPDLIA